jgi:hypothetical protein
MKVVPDIVFADTGYQIKITVLWDVMPCNLADQNMQPLS